MRKLIASLNGRAIGTLAEGNVCLADEARLVATVKHRIVRDMFQRLDAAQ